MDKRHKTPLEKRMRQWTISLCILGPLLFGVLLWVLLRFVAPH
jgi:uncharacterized membrane protein YhdT